MDVYESIAYNCLRWMCMNLLLGIDLLLLFGFSYMRDGWEKNLVLKFYDVAGSNLLG